MIKPGSTKMIDESVPAAEATVCTILFSWMVASRNPRRIAIEITAAGIDVEKVRPALRPKYTLAAVNTSVMTIPMISPRMVSSARIFAWDCVVRPFRLQARLKEHWCYALPVFALRARSEEHTSELQSQFHLVCRLLLEKK